MRRYRFIQDLEDIGASLRANRNKLDLAEVRQCFQLFTASRYSMTFSGNSTDQPFADDGGIKPALVSDQDPLPRARWPDVRCRGPVPDLAGAERVCRVRQDAVVIAFREAFGADFLDKLID